MSTSDARALTIAVGRRLASTRGEHVCALFADTLAGDLARLRARARIRQLLPAAGSEFIEYLIEEYLTP